MLSNDPSLLSTTRPLRATSGAGLLRGALIGLLFIACTSGCGESSGGESSDSSAATSQTDTEATQTPAGESQGDDGTTDAVPVEVLSVEQAAELISKKDDRLVVLDVRTQEEHDEVHLEGVTLIDFYQDDFAAQLADLDPTLQYVVYCRSGNRSGQATALMQTLGFTEVYDVDGGMNQWLTAGLAVAES